MPARSSTAPKRAMVLAAGLGKRMRPITVTTPKPLVEVAGRALIDRALDALAAAGVETAIVNVHYLADLVSVHVARRKSPKIVVSDERSGLLDTGGGIVKALPLLGDRPFLLLSSDHGTEPRDPSWDAFWANQTGYARELSLSGSAHCSFNDGLVLYPQAASTIGLPDDVLAELVGTLDPERSLTIQRTYLRAFFDEHLRHESGRLLRAPSPRYPEIQFVR